MVEEKLMVEEAIKFILDALDELHKGCDEDYCPAYDEIRCYIWRALARLYQVMGQEWFETYFPKYDYKETIKKLELCEGD